MKKYLSYLLLCGILGMGMGIQQTSMAQKTDAKVSKKDKPAKTVDPNKPQFKFDQEIYDFGDVPAGTDVSHTFQFKNVGKTPMTILSAKGSCGCTKVEASYSPILPNKSDKITARYHAAADGSGKFVKLITIYSNAEPRLKTLTIKGNIVPKKKGQ